MHDAPTEILPAHQPPKRRTRPGVRQRRLHAWRRALRREDLPAAAVLVLTQRVLRIQDQLRAEARRRSEDRQSGYYIE